MTRLGLLLCALAGAAGSSAACHHEYSEEEKWRACCRMNIAFTKLTSDSAKTIVSLLPSSSFEPTTGKLPAGLMKDESPGRGGAMQNILTAMNKFLADRPKDHPSDYFRALGLTCKPAAVGSADGMRCEIELPIHVTCSTFGAWSLPPRPEGLPQYIPARLHWQVDVSQSALLATDAQVQPMPGGRLCHR